ncbi:cytochrome P450 [Actinokineospora soli]|uniref:Cytochrome P450 n=1 Tax=Actinokineospora soli TaxID=1048753 RepID=A0ABW2TTL5_9PSEU
MSAEATAPPSPTLPDRLPPGPRLPMVAQTLLYRVRRHTWLPKLRERYGDVIAVKTFPEGPVVLLADPDHIRALFAASPSTYHAGEGKLIMTPMLGEQSVMLTDEERHQRVRRLLMPAFTGAALRGYRELMAAAAREEVATWVPGVPFAAHPRMQAVTLEIILRVVFGLADSPRHAELRTLLAEVIDVGALHLIGWQNPDLRRFEPWRGHARIQSRVDELLRAEITERAAVVDLPDRADVLSRLLTANRTATGDDVLTDDEIRDQLVTLLLAGHESTATALAWALHDLARSPAWQADRSDEVLEAVVKESMRLHPVVYEVARKTTEDVEIGGYRIPAGWTIMPSINLVHFNETLHPSALEFRPDRFLAGSVAPPTWIPFGGGIRRCLGAAFSLLEATEILRAALDHYHVWPDRPEVEQPVPRNVTMPLAAAPASS